MDLPCHSTVVHQVYLGDAFMLVTPSWLCILEHCFIFSLVIRVAYATSLYDSCGCYTTYGVYYLFHWSIRQKVLVMAFRENALSAKSYQLLRTIVVAYGSSRNPHGVVAKGGVKHHTIWPWSLCPGEKWEKSDYIINLN